MYVCTIVPSIKAMWHNILKSLENGFALGKTSHWDDFNLYYPEKISKLSSKEDGVKATSNPVSIFSKY